MSAHEATIIWNKQESELFIDNKYNRKHIWSFDGGITLVASPSPNIVPVPYSTPSAIDPEEAFVASLSSCHMLFFLSFAAKQNLIVENYTDNAVGILVHENGDQAWMKQVTLKPKVTFSKSERPSIEMIQDLHNKAHASCFIANSVKSEIILEIAD